MNFVTKLLEWYGTSGRKLPWRNHPNPYAVWVSEIMLQQTRVETVIPYFEKWMKLFPDIRSLAGASESEVLNAWEGLGYYTRVRNLHTAAKILVNEYQGRLPADAASLRKLPGIGRYTAGAIASMAYGLDEAVLDGNLKRVFARVFNVQEVIDAPAGEKILWDLAQRHLPSGQAADYNQALMDLGAMICAPLNPDCAICPVKEYCQAYKLYLQGMRPVRKPKRSVPHRLQMAAVIVHGEQVLLSKRPSKGLLAGMWEFPKVEVSDRVRNWEILLEEEYGVKIRKGDEFATIDHAYTHFTVTVCAFRCQSDLVCEKENLQWSGINALDDFPMGKVDRQIARKLIL
ncbi:MAG: A/G-specific adenine glycosylase [Anaerolineales bacterium]|nr:A/G-specific adenine glycosylase [Anaerolineales bacterium]